MEDLHRMYQYQKQNTEKNIRKNLVIAALIGAVPFLLIAGFGLFDWTRITTQDYRVGALFYNLRTPLRTTIAAIITRIGDVEGQIVITAVMMLVLFIAKKWRTVLWYGLTVLIGAALLNSGIKNIYQRVRPEEIDHLIEQSGYSFPSGHSMGSIIVFGGIIFLAFRYFKSEAIKWSLGIFFGLLILIIGLSRIYLGVHYPSDVIAGFSLGFAWLMLSIAFLGMKLTGEDFQSKKRYSFKDFSQ